VPKYRVVKNIAIFSNSPKKGVMVSVILTYTVAMFTDNSGSNYTGSPITGKAKQDGLFLVLRDKYGFIKLQLKITNFKSK
jgi:hypothetical protein